MRKGYIQGDRTHVVGLYEEGLSDRKKNCKDINRVADKKGRLDIPP